MGEPDGPAVESSLVAQDNPERVARTGVQQLVGLRRLVELEVMRDHRLHRDSGEQGENIFHPPAEGPPRLETGAHAAHLRAHDSMSTEMELWRQRERNGTRA